MPDHWAMTGRDVPGSGSPDEAVFLPARNILLLSKAMLWCHLRGVSAVALATLKANPFPDATPGFFASFAAAVNQGIGSRVEVLRPYEHLSKAEILMRGRHLPLDQTFSCLRPVTGQHCGVCNKCEERRRAFASVGMTDPTPYARPA